MDKVKIKVNIVTILMCIISFYTTFRNVNIYIFGGQNHPISILLDIVFLFLLLLGLLVIIVKRISAKHYFLKSSLMIVIVLFLWVIVQSLINTVVSGENYIPRNLLSGILAFIVLSLGIENQKQFDSVFRAFIFGAVISALFPLLKFSNAIGIRTTLYQGIYYPGGLWNNILISFTSSGWLILAFIQRKEINTTQKLIGIASFIVLWLGAFAGVSRTFLLGTFVSVVVFALSSKNIKRLIQLLIVLVIFISAVEILLPDTLTNIFSRLTNTFGNLSEESRVVIWTTYLSNFLNYGLTGSLGDYQSYGTDTVTYGTHSVFLNWLVQYGLIGLLAFIALLISIVQEVFSLKNIKPTEFSLLLAWFSGYLIQITISETGFVEASFYVGLAFVLMWGNFTKVDDRIDLESKMIAKN